jgi:hypothetical protein
VTHCPNCGYPAAVNSQPHCKVRDCSWNDCMKCLHTYDRNDGRFFENSKLINNRKGGKAAA